MDPVEQLNKNPQKTSHKIPEIRELRALKKSKWFSFSFCVGCNYSCVQKLHFSGKCHNYAWSQIMTYRQHCMNPSWIRQSQNALQQTMLFTNILITHSILKSIIKKFSLIKKYKYIIILCSFYVFLCLLQHHNASYYRQTVS